MKENNKGSDSGHDFMRTSLVLGCFFLLLFYVLPVSAANQNSGVSSSPEWVIGVPWEGETGITETVGQIMQRERARELIRGPEVQRIIPFRTNPNRKNNPQNPASPAVSGSPASSGIGPLISVRPYTPQVVGPPNFLGATLADTGAFPPDTMGAVGPTQYIVALNGRIRSFTKAGVLDHMLDVDTDAFFTSVMTQPVSSNFTSDIRIRYDRLSGRWFITMIDVPGLSATQPNRIMIAVSSGDTIIGTSSFTFFQFQQDLPPPNADTGKFADYPTLGIDANALYIGVNIFNSSGNFTGTTGFVVRKSSILGAGPIFVTAFRGLVPSPGTSDGPYTPQGVDNYDPSATQGYFIGVSNTLFGELVLRRISNPGGTPSISGNVFITVPATFYPLSVPHRGNTGGTNGNLDALDDRLFAAHLRNGSLWTAHNIGLNSAGASIVDHSTIPPTCPTCDRDGSRWYEIDNLSTTPTLRQSGTVFDNAATTPRFYWIPSIMVSGQGHAAMGFSTAGTNYFVDAATVGRLEGDPGGTMQTPFLYTTSTTSYNPLNDPGALGAPRRWGDFSYTSLDPSDDMTMWTIQEFCNATNSYGVQVVKLLAPPPATPSSASPSSVHTGLNSPVDVVVTGTSTNGSGFFDPGPGFDNRIDADIDLVGSNILINSVTYTDPTHVTLNISTKFASPGSFDVTVTNPDGQSATSTSPIFTITAPCSAIISPSGPALDATYGVLFSQQFSASGCTSPYTFALTGQLPTGMTFSDPTLSGTPFQVGSFPITVTATDAEGASASQGYTLTVTTAPGTAAVQIQNGPVPFQSIQSAYDHPVVNGDIIQAQAIDFVESPVFDNPNNLNPFSITLSGGWDQAFSTNTGTYTKIMGSLTIAKGTVTIENVIFH
ncbi:MAG: Ig domain-containing protein [Thermodesulfovibrionales bacterium]